MFSTVTGTAGGDVVDHDGYWRWHGPPFRSADEEVHSLPAWSKAMEFV